MSGLLSNTSPGSSVSLQKSLPCPYADVVPQSLFPTDCILKTRVFVQRLKAESVRGLVAEELVRQSRILLEYQLKKSVSASVKETVLVCHNREIWSRSSIVNTPVSPARTSPSSRVFT